MGTKTVYPVPGVKLPNVEAEKQTVDGAWAEELVSSGAFSYDDITEEQREGLREQERKRVLDAEQSNADLNWAKMETKNAAVDAGKVPDEGTTKVSPDPAAPEEPRKIAGLTTSDLRSDSAKALDKAEDKAAGKG